MLTILWSWRFLVLFGVAGILPTRFRQTSIISKTICFSSLLCHTVHPDSCCTCGGKPKFQDWIHIGITTFLRPRLQVGRSSLLSCWALKDFQSVASLSRCFLELRLHVESKKNTCFEHLEHFPWSQTLQNPSF